MTNSKLNYFKNCTTLEEVKSLYKELAKTNHPDKGGDIVVMQAINAEYSIACKIIASGAGMTSEEFEQSILDSEAYKNAINAVINLENITVECVGNWVWVTGNTYPHKDILKSAGFMFAGKKKAWYFRTADFAVKNRNNRFSLEDIKNKYGSKVISANYQRSIA